jgi:hypothetical protein
MFNDTARVCSDCGATVSTDLNECWLCQARAGRPQIVQTELAEEKVPAKNESQEASPLVLKLIARKNSNPDNSQNWGSLETTLLAVASGLVLLVYAAACCGYLGLFSFQRVVLVILIGPAALRAITLGALQRDIDASALLRERAILFAGSLVVMVVTTCLALGAFLIVGIPLSILAGGNCWNGSKEPTTDLRIRMAFVLAIVAAVAAAALIIFETWIAYFVFYRPKEGLPVGLSDFCGCNARVA